MKPLNHLLMAAAVTLGISFSAQAGDVNLAIDRPIGNVKAWELARSFRRVPSAVSDVNLVANRPIGNVKAWELARNFRRVPTTGPGINLAHAPRPTLSPKDPRYEAAWRANARREFQIAPMK